MKEKSQEDFGTQMLFKMLIEEQKSMNGKLDALHKFIEDHMTKEEQELVITRVHLASLEEKVAGQSRRWGMISTIITSIVSAVGASYFLRHRV